MVLFSLFYYLPRVKPGPSVKAAQVQTASHPTHTSLSSPEGEGFCAALPLNLHPLSAPLLERVWRQKHGKLRGIHIMRAIWFRCLSPHWSPGLIWLIWLARWVSPFLSHLSLCIPPKAARSVEEDNHPQERRTGPRSRACKQWCFPARTSNKLSE